MAFEDFLVTLRDDQLGKLRCQKPLQPPNAPQFLNLFRDPRFETAVQFRYLIGALTQFIQQPGVLHRDDRLRREVLQQRNLLVGEGANLDPTSGDDTEEGTIATQWHKQ